ncbi:hypothetical protein CVT26_010424 [Gymnopilus dilepis]|uniref:F-box domain-containing protein n=1 Tax=Gymnopilus dilepis TaxID=231916 RepID=A0A409VZ78_9AGAR|nr:hypothetical protein CVT26_010424 [Gymnopilus dilepis]
MLRLPPELQDEIISLLQYDKKSLSTCALVCRTLLPLCQKYLYAGVTIESTTRPNALSSIQFQQILSKWTYLLGAVQYIEIIDTEFSSIRGETPEWLSRDRALARCLPQLHSLKGLSIRYRQDQWQNWEGLSEGLLRAIIERLSSPSLAYLHIQNVPLALLRFCPNIKYLSVRVAGHSTSALNSNIVLFMPIPPIFQPPGGICSPESLRIVVGSRPSPSGPTSWFLGLKANGISFQKLKNFHARVYGSLDQHGIIQSILEDCANTLEEFVFDPSIETSWEPFSAGRLELGIMKRLRTLAVRLDIVFQSADQPNLGNWSESMPWFVGLLKTFASAGRHPLEVLKIRVNHAIEDGQYNAEPWVEMASFLGNNETFPLFRNLKLQFCSFSGQEKGIAAFSRLASDLASRLEGVRVHAVFLEDGALKSLCLCRLKDVNL